jgi:UDP-glucose 4-epimerase
VEALRSRAMRILVTGGAGFIGSNLAQRLVANGHVVAVVDDFSTGKRDNLAAFEAQVYDADITTPAAAHAVEEFRPDVMCHLAAQIDVRVSVDDPLRDATVNLLGTINLLEAARRSAVGKVVFASSGGTIYGEPPAEALPLGEDFDGHPSSQYGASKRSVEEYLHTYQALYGLRWTALALANVYGPRQDPWGEAGVVAIFGTRMLRGEPVTIYGDGGQTRDFVFVGDVVDAFTAALTAGDNRRCNIGTGQQTSVNELYAAMAAICGYDQPPQYAEERAGEIRNAALSYSRAQAELGWSPATPLPEGLAQTVEWLRTTL